MPAVLGSAIALLTLMASTSAGEVRFGGTFIAAVVCEDGIVVASDSRSTFIDDMGHPFGYIDGMPKIFAGRGPAVAVSGLSSMGDELLSSFIRRNAFLLERTADEILFGFAVNLPFKNTNSVAMLSAGFLKGKPSVCGRTPFDPLRCTSAGYFSNKNSGILRDSITKLGRPPRVEEAVPILKQAIWDFAASDIAVGGPISILYLRESAAPVWLENEPHDNGWARICDLVSAHRQGRAAIRPTGSPQELNRRLDAVCPR
jgi:hypothetical protein